MLLDMPGTKVGDEFMVIGQSNVYGTWLLKVEIVSFANGTITNILKFKNVNKLHGPKTYEHHFCMFGSSGQFAFRFCIKNTQSAPYFSNSSVTDDILSQIALLLQSQSFNSFTTALEATGFYVGSSANGIVSGIYAGTSSPPAVTVATGGGGSITLVTRNANITDHVVPIDN